ncbi:MAG: proline racemase family protein, partial [Gemmataceae bacterium]|nr:proline racemase family protein [Gemmataceae bacterium]
DSHTGGEPTRVVIKGGPDLGTNNLTERLDSFRTHFDEYRRAILCEPRGSDVLVGAILCKPVDPSCISGVIFFNNVGYLGMCGHGTIGLAVTLGHLGMITKGNHDLETPIGKINFTFDGFNTVSLENVPSYRLKKNVSINVEGVGMISGDVAWGGNWFFLVSDHHETLTHSNTSRLTHVAQRIQSALRQQGITGTNNAEIDHIELFGPPLTPNNQSRNFVLCPGGAYDRSPCGTGTSAKIACLASDGKLQPGEVWRQESILGSVFEASFRLQGDLILPRISGTAFITAETTILIDDADPFAWGIPS